MQPKNLQANGVWRQFQLGGEGGGHRDLLGEKNVGRAAPYEKYSGTEARHAEEGHSDTAY